MPISRDYLHSITPMIVPHGHLSFFKYMTASTGMAILENSSFRWSNPDLFNKYNDKFDVPRVIAEGISSSDLEKARVKQMTRRPEEELGNPFEVFRVKFRISTFSVF
jgi:hypothetical protein